MKFVKIENLSKAAFKKLDLRLKQLKTEDKIPPIQVDSTTFIPYIEVDGKNYPIEDMLNREALEKAATIKLMKGRLLLKHVSDPNASKNGLVVVSSQDVPRRGKVVGVGPDLTVKKKTVTAPCEIGDVIVYMSGKHQEVHIHEEKYIVIMFEDVLVKLKE